MVISKYPIRRFEYVTVVNVVDGDTVDLEVDLGFSVKVKHRFRLARINTPERGQPGYEEAKQFLVERCLGKAVVIESTKLDKYERYLCEILVGEENMNNALLTAGLAKPYE